MNLCPVEPLVKIEDEEKKGKRGKKSGRIRLERRPRKGKRRR